MGDAVVCPCRGIGVTVDRAVSDQQGARREYLTIRVERLRMTVMLPVASAARAGLRPLAGLTRSIRRCRPGLMRRRVHPTGGRHG